VRQGDGGFDSASIMRYHTLGVLTLPRKARQRSESGIYHLMIRGINRQHIFKDVEDMRYFLQVLHKLKNECEFALYGYCFMGNHVHLLLHENSVSISQIMRKLGSSYVYWYNRKYERVGYLFQDRFKSESVEDDSYFLTVLRYIHQNPFKAGLTASIKQYKWSSYPDYLSTKGATDIDFALNIFSQSRKKAIDQFIDFHNEKNDDCCLDMETIQRLPDKEAIEIITGLCGVEKPSDLQKVSASDRDAYLKQLKEKHNLSIRQIERLTGIDRNVVFRA